MRFIRIYKQQIILNAVPIWTRARYSDRARATGHDANKEFSQMGVVLCGCVNRKSVWDTNSIKKLYKIAWVRSFYKFNLVIKK